MIWPRVPLPVRSLFPGAVWSVKTSVKELFLTFDDGPSPLETSFVLDELKRFNAKACFFMVGNNVLKHPDVLSRVVREGHSLGNHTYSHINGWKSGRSEYLDNVLKCSEVLSTRLFRPPYGRILPAQAKLLKRAGYKLIMWDLLSYDFDSTKTKKEILHHLMKRVKPGSIVVFHDSPKAFPLLKLVLPEFLEQCRNRGFTFSPLEIKD